MKKYLLTMMVMGLCLFTVSQEMQHILGGSFDMGSNNGEVDEKPIHSVTLSSFKIDKHEVSNREYDACVQSGKCQPAHYTDGKCYIWSSEGLKKTKIPTYFQQANRPVVCVSWQQARAYCRAQGKRLPTEAEWEYAATAKGGSEYSIGRSPSSTSARFQSGSSAPVKSFPQGYAQLSDMCGNSWEWVYDRYEKEYYSYSERNNPKGPRVGRFRVIRGGGWYSALSQLRGKNRHWFAPEVGEVSIGFRCAQ